MAANRSTATDGLRGYPHRHWRWYAIQGALFIIVGFLAVVAPFAATWMVTTILPGWFFPLTLATSDFFGWLFLTGGILGIVSAFRGREAPGFRSNLLFAALAAILGATILRNPLAGAVPFTSILATFLILSGVLNFTMAGAFRSSTGHWLMIVSGVLDLLLALALLTFLWITVAWEMGVLVGISFMSSGFALLFATFDARNEPVARA